MSEGHSAQPGNRRRRSGATPTVEEAVSTATRFDGAPGDGQYYRTRALLRGLELLSCFRPETPELSLGDCVERTGLDKATAFRLLTCLTEAGFLYRDPDRPSYRVGAAILPIASAFHEGNALAAIAEPHVRALAMQTAQTATLALWDGAMTVSILVIHSDRPLRRFSYVGERFPLHTTSVGKAIAAHLHPEQLEALVGGGGLLQVTPKTITSLSDFIEELQRVKRQGYAIDDEEAIVGVRCVGWVIRDYRGRPIAAVSIAGAAGEFVGDALQHYARTVNQTANAISTQIGFLAQEGATR